MAIALAVAMGVAACGVDVPPAITAPPPPADAVTWPEITFGASVVARPAGAWTNERVVAVAASEAGFAAVGLAEGQGIERGQAWLSTDGLAWERSDAPDVFNGVSLIDIASGPGGFIALGTSVVDPRLAAQSRLTLFRSADGRRWERLPDVVGAPGGIADGVAGGPQGYVAVGFRDPEPGSIILVSDDGVAWRSVGAAAAGAAADAISAPVAVDGGGWRAVGGSTGGLTVLRSEDGATWTADIVEGAGTNGIALTRVIPGPYGLLAIGLTGPRCGAVYNSCPASSTAWWSADGTSWGRVADIEAAAPYGAIAADPRRGFLSLDREALASPDGWAWTSLGSWNDDRIDVLDVAIRDDLVVGVGASFDVNGAMRAAFLVGGTDIEIPE